MATTHWPHPLVVSIHPVPPTSHALKHPCQSLTLPSGVLGGAGWAPDTPSSGPGRNVWLRHFDDCGSASTGEAWGVGRGPVAQTHRDYPKRLCVHARPLPNICAFDPGASLCARAMGCAPEAPSLYFLPLWEKALAHLWQPGGRATVQP